MTLRVNRKFLPIQDDDDAGAVTFEAPVWEWTDGVVKVGTQNYPHYARGLLLCYIDDKRVDLTSFMIALHGHDMSLDTITTAIDAAIATQGKA